MPREREFEWRAGRFKDAVLYIAEQLTDDPTFGSTKLNKILYFSDMDAYRLLGEPITGAVYQKNHYGPTAREYPPLILEMQREELITIGKRKIVDHNQDSIKPTGKFKANTEQFTPEQMQILDARIEEFRAYNNTQASDRSHERSAGWLLAHDLLEAIPYSTALINPEPLDAPALAGLKAQPIY